MAADDPDRGETYSDEETAARREETLRRMLATPPKPHKPLNEKRR
ncbi:MAG TPA: hypothetical protein VF650_13305 [Allosphingosinicella sp.]|jgi:hypothetical protein